VKTSFSDAKYCVKRQNAEIQLLHTCSDHICFESLTNLVL